MIKYFTMQIVLLALALMIAQAPVQIPEKAPERIVSGGQQVQSDAEGQRNPTNSPIVNEKTSTPENQSKTSGVENKPNEINLSVRELPVIKTKPDKVYRWLTAALVGISAFTFWAIWYQARKTALSVEAGLRSIKLQETAMRQWVTIENWVCAQKASTERVILDLSFDIINRTNMPFTLLTTSAEINGVRTDVPNKSFLVPNDWQRIYVSVVLKPEQITQYTSNMLILDLTGFIWYKDAFGNAQVQSVGKTCGFSGINGNFFGPYHGELPQPVEDLNHKQKP